MTADAIEAAERALDRFERKGHRVSAELARRRLRDLKLGPAPEEP
jgi:hypothetical protein